MSEGFTVDLHALERAASGVAGVLTEVHKRNVKDIPHDEASVGHHALAGTLTDFCDRWQRGVDNIAKDGKEIVDRLQRSAQAYRDVEQNTQREINGMLRSSGPDPAAR